MFLGENHGKPVLISDLKLYFVENPQVSVYSSVVDMFCLDVPHGDCQRLDHLGVHSFKTESVSHQRLVFDHRLVMACGGHSHSKHHPMSRAISNCIKPLLGMVCLFKIYIKL